MTDLRAERRSRPGAANSDDLGLRRAMSDALLPSVVAAMAFLAALALAGVLAAAALAEHWQQGAAAALTVQVPDADRDGRLGRVLEALRRAPGVLEARPLEAKELEDLLRPWLGSGGGRIALPLPALVAVKLANVEMGAGADLAALGLRLQATAPGTLIESEDAWARRLAVLARSIQACAAVAMGVVGFVAVAVVMVATRAGLAMRREAIEIVHGLGGTDGFIAGRFAGRAMRLAAVGGAAGAVVALPVLLGLGGLAAPFVGGAEWGGAGLGRAEWGDGGWYQAELMRTMPRALWAGLPGLPLMAGAIGWVTAQATVRRWLRRLP